jgi:hypothetical protein
MLDLGRVAMMPNNGKIPPALIAKYVRQGAAIFAQIQNGHYQQFQPNQSPQPVGEDEVALVMWYLQALASSKASASAGQDPNELRSFKEGGLLIEDGQGHLEHFFKLANSYERISSHFPQFQNQAGCGASGVDIFNVPLPNGRKSVLFQKLPQDEPTTNSGLIYVKMEPHGQRGLSLKGTGRRGDVSIGFFGALKRFFANLGDRLGRAFSRDHSLAARAAGVDNLEITPPGLSDKFFSFSYSLLEEIGSSLPFEPIVNTIFDSMVDNSSQQVYKAFKAINQALRQAEAIEDGTAGKERCIERLNQFKNQILLPLGDHSQLRFGREVILTQNEFGQIFPQPVTDRNWEGTIQGSRRTNERENQELENHMNAMFSMRGAQQAQEIRYCNLDFKRGANLTLFQASQQEGQPPEIIYDTHTDQRARSPELVQNGLAPEPSDGKYLPEVIDERLRDFGGSQAFSDLMRIPLSHISQGDLLALTDYQFLTHTGRFIGETAFTLGNAFTLTRLSPPVLPGQSRPTIERYEFKVTCQARDLTDEEHDENGGHYQGSVNPFMTLELFYNNAENTMNARIKEAQVSYDITRTSN